MAKSYPKFRKPPAKPTVVIQDKRRKVLAKIAKKEAKL